MFYSRRILGWTLDNTLAAENCTRLLEECVLRHGAPEIVKVGWKTMLDKYGIQMSMDGRGRCKDNIWIERFWRTIKQEYIYLNPTGACPTIERWIGWFIDYYNTNRPH